MQAVGERLWGRPVPAASMMGPVDISQIHGQPSIWDPGLRCSLEFVLASNYFLNSPAFVIVLLRGCQGYHGN